MGKMVKSAAKGVVKTVANIPKTFATTAKNAGKASFDLGKSLVGANGGNYFKDLGNSSSEALAQSANVLVTSGSVGTTSLNDPSQGGNSVDGQVAGLMGKTGGLDAPTAPTLDNTEDPALKEELDNAKKKGRASTVLAGGTDAGKSSSSAKKTLLGSL